MPTLLQYCTACNGAFIASCIWQLHASHLSSTSIPSFSAWSQQFGVAFTNEPLNSFPNSNDNHSFSQCCCSYCYVYMHILPLFSLTVYCFIYSKLINKLFQSVYLTKSKSIHSFISPINSLLYNSDNLFISIVLSAHQHFTQIHYCISLI